MKKINHNYWRLFVWPSHVCISVWDCVSDSTCVCVIEVVLSVLSRECVCVRVHGLERG